MRLVKIRGEEYESVTNVIVVEEAASPEYSVNQAFAEEIDEWDYNGRMQRVLFILGSTGEVLQGLGAIESDIYMLGDKIKQILVDHPEISLEEIKKIPQMLDDPIIILKSRNVGREHRANSRLVIFGSVKAANGLPVLSVLDLRPIENHLLISDMQKVDSTYTKNNKPVEFIRASEVLYMEEKRTPRLLRAIGFQMPIALQRSGSIGMITYNRDIVNLKGIPFTDIVRQRCGM